ncbi:hypothetical protein OGAPHI_007074 [Ogataea philodendri]|uniref:Protein CMS1 n=1 Tax=Ogataea philodendri TaxID=1378263 RepID=A0A9P8NUA6_9ASCO|nr:uncharacterized protein OGAPHI_007074 [Ogataea philodendri]KAH3660488.1 hypothetical protein OGAPHI_007074 [Ogataea philodendri]
MRRMSDQADGLDDGLAYSHNNSEHELSEHGSDVEECLTETKENVNIEVSSKKRKNKTDKLSQKKKQKMEFDIEQKRSLAKESPEIIFDRLALKVRQHNPNLSALELSDLYINKSSLKSSQNFVIERTLDHLKDFLQSNLQKILNEKKFILILSVSARRACDVFRATKSIPNGALKLINKNKLQDDLAVLKKSKSRVLAATAGRVAKIINHEDNVLEPESIGGIVCDSTFLDTKLQNVWDYNETFQVIHEITSKNTHCKVYLF